MPLSDVKVRISAVKSTGTAGFGKPLIISELEGGHPYKEYANLSELEKDFATTTEVYEVAKVIMSQPDLSERIVVADSYNPKRFAVAAYDPTATGVDAITTAAALVESLLGQSWYFLVSTERDPVAIAEIADVIESSNEIGLPKLFSAQVAEATDLAGFDELDRTFVAVHPDNERIDAAIVGAVGPRTVGSVTWQGKTLEGITPQKLSSAELALIEGANGYAYVTKAGDHVTSEGKLLSGEYIDVMHGKDWIQVNIEETVQKIKNRSGKIPYTDAGITTTEAGVLSVLKTGHTQGIIAEDESGNPLYSTNFLRRAEISAEDRRLRRYTGGKFAFELAGAIHTAEINGSVSY